MKILLTADWHLTDRQEDEYRWKAAQFVLDYAGEEDNAIADVFILGDIFDRKDKFSARLLNRFGRLIVDNPLCMDSGHIVILVGNHDYQINSEEEHIRSALSLFNGMEAEPIIVVDSICHSRDMALENINALFVPHGRTVEDGLPETNLAFAHELIGGSKVGDYTIEKDNATTAENFRRVKKVFAGDVHGKQTIILGNKIKTEWTYVGAPSHTDFGSDYIPAFLVYDTETEYVESIEVPQNKVPRKETITVSSEKQIDKAFKKIPEGQMIRVILDLEESDLDLIGQYVNRLTSLAKKSILTLQGIEVVASRDNESKVSPAMTNNELFAEICRIEKITGKQRKVGEEIMVSV